MKSLTYYLTLFALKVKGVKRDFSQDPIDFRKLRKEDIQKPGNSLLSPYKPEQFKIAGSVITEIKPAKPTGQLVLFCHGGAFVYGPAAHHWQAAKAIVAGTNSTLWMIDYPKAPENKIDTISANIDAVYNKAGGIYGAENLVLIGDSVGGTLLTALSQRLVQNCLPSPALLILISPVMDATLSNPEIDALTGKDPMLAKPGVLSAKKMTSLNCNLSDARLSPLNASFAGLPRTVLFMAGHDITFPDQKLAAHEMRDAQVDLTIHFGAQMPHIWPLLPVMDEAKTALGKVIRHIKQARDYPALKRIA